MSPAAARVGVTSATEGDPTGKPPLEPERVLRVGIDVVTPTPGMRMHDIN